VNKILAVAFVVYGVLLDLREVVQKVLRKR
jgi:hypothetical protein